MISNTSFTYNPKQQFYHFEALNAFKAVAHVVTTRNSLFVSDFNLSFNTGKEEEVKKNRDLLCQYLEAKTLTIPNQCHGHRIVEVTEQNSLQIPADTDALITNQRGLAIGVFCSASIGSCTCRLERNGSQYCSGNSRTYAKCIW
jgi:copper oxidase (laccase) domain-containing protein